MELRSQKTRQRQSRWVWGQILRTAKRVRRIYEESHSDSGQYSLSGLCGDASRSLLNSLSAQGISGARFKNGTFADQGGHCWVEWGNRVIDITATQFGRFPRVYTPTAKTKARRYRDSRPHTVRTRARGRGDSRPYTLHTICRYTN